MAAAKPPALSPVGRIKVTLGCTEDDGAERLDETDLVFRHPSPEALQ